MNVKFRCLPGLKDILPPPVPATRAIPDWLREMPMTEDLGVFGEDRTVKQCPPFIDAMTTGFAIPLACDIRVSDGRFSWDWPVDTSPLEFHFASQVVGTPLFDNDKSVVKFINFWSIETEPGVSLLFTHPANRPDLPFRTLTGLVDTDQFSDLPVHFPAQWIDPEFDGVLEKGTPVAQCVAVHREPIELDIGEMDETEAAKSADLKARLSAAPGYYRDHFRRRSDKI